MVAHTTPWVITPVTQQQQGRTQVYTKESPVMDHTMEQIPKIHVSHEEHMELYKPQTSNYQIFGKLHPSWTTGTHK